MVTETAFPDAIKSEYRSILAFVGETRRNETRVRQSLVDSVGTWLNAVDAFCAMERRIGLSDDESERNAFLQVVTELIDAGRRLLAMMGNDTGKILNLAGITLEAFEANLEFLKFEKESVTHEFAPETLAKLKAIFGE